jgi:hypothetical protein
MNPDFAVKPTRYSALRLTFSGTSIKPNPRGVATKHGTDSLLLLPEGFKLLQLLRVVKQ